MRRGKTGLRAVGIAAAMAIAPGLSSATEIESIAEVLGVFVFDDIDTLVVPDIATSTSVDLAAPFAGTTTTGAIDPGTGEAAPVAEALSDSYSNGVASLTGTSDTFGPLATAGLMSVGGVPLGGVATALSVTEQLFVNIGDDGFIDIEIEYILDQIFDAADGTETAIGEIEVLASTLSGAFGSDSIFLSEDPLGGDVSVTGSLLISGLEVFAGDEIFLLTTVFAEVAAADPAVSVFEPATGIMFGLGFFSVAAAASSPPPNLRHCDR